MHVSTAGCEERVFFFGVRIWLVKTFNYPVLWVRVNGQVLGSVNYNHNPKHIYKPNPNSDPNPKLTLTISPHKP